MSKRKPEAFTARFKRAIKERSVARFLSTVNDLAKDYFAPYIVLDNYGTRILCWTLKDAEQWVSYCASSAFICETLDYTLVTSRYYQEV